MPDHDNTYTPAEIQRGYKTNRKRLLLSYGIEAMVIFCGGFAGWQFANRYAAEPEPAPTQVAALDWLLHGWAQPFGNTAWWMAVIATIGICVAELARVPLATACRTHAARGMRVLALVGVLFACIVSTKTLAQVMEQMFHPRLHEVQETMADLKTAEARLELAEKRRSGSSSISDPKVADVAKIDDKIIATQASLKEMGKQPPPVCTKAVYGKKNRKTGKRPLLRGAKCTQPEWPGKLLLAQLETLQAERTAAAGARDTAVHATASIDADIAAAKVAVADAAENHGEAVSNSQLHSFTAMVFGVDPRDVTEANLHWFLRFFVLIPAGLIACTSSILAMTSITRIPLRKRAVEVPREEDGTLASFIRDTAKRSVAVPEPARAANLNLVAGE